MKILNQYFPGRVFVLLFTENALILLGVWVAACVYIGRFNLALLFDRLAHRCRFFFAC